MKAQRREFLAALGAGAAVSALGACATTPAAKGRVVVIGGGYAGATAAKYIRMWSEGSVDVTLVEARDRFVSCPMSNLVIGGSKTLDYITIPYDNLAKRHGVKLVRDTATAVDTEKRIVTTAGGQKLAYDRLIVAPGIDFIWSSLPAMAKNPDAAVQVAPHAWIAGPQTVLLRRQLEAMPDGGVAVISIPRAPYRCPPGPYERACQIAWYFKNRKPKSKVLILDGNDDIQSKKGLFLKVWGEDYKGLIEYRANHVLTDVDLATRTLKFEVQGDVKADVINVIPPQRAGAIARAAGVVTANDRWCEVDFLSYESIKVKNVHVLGDAIQIAPGMPKSGHMANQHAKVCAAAVVALLSGQTVNPTPVVTNTCYSMTNDTDTMHVASVHQYDAGKKTMLTVPGSGGLSTAPTALEGRYAFAWAQNIWADMLA
ncbi:MAG TPA: NAD(P)/FAD-dependent oxidoreductase [Burkholderiaceae bacterium]|jgi:NADPH-dependent 2,4-dienoyl-CoA reductase/sulfur reductase-like enzyme|nr:NAD(P)/FAD-dependent oxidoreductase [Burkholderiaceae bacterium]